MKFDKIQTELLKKIENLPNLDANLDFGDVVRIFNQNADAEFKKQIYDLASLAEIKKVKGHNGNLGNELADQLATGRRKINVK